MTKVNETPKRYRFLVESIMADGMNWYTIATCYDAFAVAEVVRILVDAAVDGPTQVRVQKLLAENPLA